MKEDIGGMAGQSPRLHAGAVLASALAGTANARNPDSGVPTPSVPDSFPSEKMKKSPVGLFR